MPDGSAVLLSSSLSQSWTECSRMHGCCKHECMIARGRGCGSPSGTHAACVSVTATLQEECGSAALDLELASRRDCSSIYTDTVTGIGYDTYRIRRYALSQKTLIRGYD